MSVDLEPGKPVAIYYSYHRRDRSWLDRLDAHLDNLRRRRLIDTWHEGLIKMGEQAEREIALHWEQAQIILLLISPEYLADDRCHRQMELAVAKAERTQIQVIPVLVRFVELEYTPLHQLQPLPRNGKPISQWRRKDVALAEVADGVHSVLNLSNIQRSMRNGIQFMDKELSDALPPYAHSTILKREDHVQEIYTQLVQPDTSVVVLRGMGRIGKSTLAAQVYDYAERQRLIGKGLFNREALWLRIQPTMTLRSLTTKIAAALEQWTSDLESLLPEELALKLFRLLKESNGRRLIVLDDFGLWLDQQDGKVQADYAGVSEWLDMLNGSPCANRVLITTRIMPQSRYEYRHMCLKDFDLQGLTREEVKTLLNLWGVQVTQKELEHTFKLCNGHPFALVLLDKLLRSRGINLATLLNETVYKRLWVSNMELTLFNGIYEQLDDLQRTLLFAFAVYREAVPWHAAYNIVHTCQQATEEQFQRASGVLLALALLQRESRGKEELYELHPLVVEFVRGCFSTKKLLQEIGDWGSAHAEAAYYYQRQCSYRSPEKKQRIEDAHLEVEAVWHYCQAELWQEGYELLQQKSLFPSLRRWGEYAVLRELYTAFLLSEKWHPGARIAARMYNELGEVYNELGRKDEAQSCFEKALERSRTAAIRTEEVKSLNNLGSICRAYGRIEQALAYYQDAMQLSEQAEEPVEKGVTLNNLGRALQSLGQMERAAKKSRKFYRNALIYYKQGLTIHKEAKNDAEVARTLNNLGEVYVLLGRLKDAYNCYIQTLKIFREMGEKRGEGVVCNNIGDFYRRSEQYLDALEYHTYALRVFQQIGARRDEAIVLRNLGYIYIMIERQRVALACFLLARDIYEEICQPERGVISRGLQAFLADGQPFDQAVTSISPHVTQILEEVLSVEITK